MEQIILSILFKTVFAYIFNLFTKTKNHSSIGSRKSGYELNIKIKFKRD